MIEPNKKLYEESIEKSMLAIADKAKRSYIFNGKKYMQINFDKMTAREAINYLTSLYNIIGTVDAEHQAEFEADPIVDRLINVSYQTYKNAKNNPIIWKDVSAAQKNIARNCIDPFLSRLGLTEDPNTVAFTARIAGSERRYNEAFDNDDIKIFDPAKIPDLAQQIIAANERYSREYPNPIKKS